MPASPETSGGPAIVPRDAASLVIIDHKADGAWVLLGKRRTTQAFAPGKFVFPGGGVDADDLVFAAASPGRLPDHDRAALRHAPGPHSAGTEPEAYGLAAIRETFEETGLAVGLPANGSPGAAAASAWVPFVSLRLEPNLGALSFIARAITPPGRSRRFDARFFIADAAAITRQTAATDGEFEEVGWYALDAALTLDLHGMTRQIVEDARRHLARTPQERRLAPVPFYFQGPDGWQQRPIARF